MKSPKHLESWQVGRWPVSRKTLGLHVPKNTSILEINKSHNMELRFDFKNQGTWYVFFQYWPKILGSLTSTRKQRVNFNWLWQVLQINAAFMRFGHASYEIPNLVSPSNQWDTGTLECNSRFNLKELWTLGRRSKLALFATKDRKKVANFESCEVCWVNCSPHHSTKHGASWRSSVFSWQTFLRPGSVQPHCSLWPFQCIYAQFQWKKTLKSSLRDFGNKLCCHFPHFKISFPPAPQFTNLKKGRPRTFICDTRSRKTAVFSRFMTLRSSTNLPRKIHHVQNRECTQQGVTKRYTQMFFWGDVIEKKTGMAEVLLGKTAPIGGHMIHSLELCSFRWCLAEISATKTQRELPLFRSIKVEMFKT